MFSISLYEIDIFFSLLLFASIFFLSFFKKEKKTHYIQIGKYFYFCPRKRVPMESFVGPDRVDIRAESLTDLRFSILVCCSSSSLFDGLSFCRPLRRPVSLLGVRGDGDVGRFRVFVTDDGVESSLFPISLSPSICCCD